MRLSSLPCGLRVHSTNSGYSISYPIRLSRCFVPHSVKRAKGKRLGYVVSAELLNLTWGWSILSGYEIIKQFG